MVIFFQTQQNRIRLIKSKRVVKSLKKNHLKWKVQQNKSILNRNGLINVFMKKLKMNYLFKETSISNCISQSYQSGINL